MMVVIQDVATASWHISKKDESRYLKEAFILYDFILGAKRFALLELLNMSIW